MPTLMLWLVFLAAGLDPEFVFDRLRQAAWVVPHKAVINSSHVITVVFSGYVAMFTFNECRRLRLSSPEALIRAVQVGILGIFAFLPLSLTLDLWQEANSIHGTSFVVMTYRSLAFSVWPAKLVAWGILAVTVTRYYLLGNDLAFVTSFWFVRPASDTGFQPEANTGQPPLDPHAAPGRPSPTGRSSTTEPSQKP